MKKLLILILLLSLFSCPDKKCKALRSVYKSSAKEQGNSKLNPHIVDLERVYWFVAPSKKNNDSYVVYYWIGVNGDATIKNDTTHIRGANLIVKGNLNGSGVLVIESHQKDKEYNFTQASKLIVEGETYKSCFFI